MREGFDLAVRGGPLTDSSLLSRKIGESEFGLFASPAYLDAAGRPRRLADLARHECILHRSGCGAATWRLTGPRGEEEVVAQGRVDTDEYAFVRSMVLAGFGIALTPLTLFRALVDTGQVERVLPRFADRSAPVHVVWPSRRFEPAAVALFREALMRELPRAIAARHPG